MDKCLWRRFCCSLNSIVLVAFVALYLSYRNSPSVDQDSSSSEAVTSQEESLSSASGNRGQDDLAQLFIAQTKRPLNVEVESQLNADAVDVVAPFAEGKPPSLSQRDTQSGLPVLDVVHVYTNAESNAGLKEKFRVCTNSLLKHASGPIRYHLIGDAASRSIALAAINESARVWNAEVSAVVEYDMDEIARKVTERLGDILSYFRFKPQAYYGQNLFFVSMILHEVLPESLERVIMLDADLKFTRDIRELFGHFAQFSAEQIIGIAHDLQPIYRHVFASYRLKHPGTNIGEPISLMRNGVPGFNSGVLLMDLAKMRHSAKYQRFLDDHELVRQLVSKYSFQGHLGDQDFYSLLSVENAELFFTIPCQWNRQLCAWWKDHGYANVFDAYFSCEEPIFVFHGNCNTPIPDD